MDKSSYKLLWRIFDKQYGGSKCRKTNKYQKLIEFTDLPNLTLDSLKKFCYILVEVWASLKTQKKSELKKKNSFVLLTTKHKLDPYQLEKYHKWRDGRRKRDTFNTFVEWVEKEIEDQRHSREETLRRRSSSYKQKTVTTLITRKGSDESSDAVEHEQEEESSRDLKPEVICAMPIQLKLSRRYS